MRITPSATMLTLLACLAVTCGSAQTLNGTLSLSATVPVTGTDQRCAGTGGFADVQPGMSVTVKDAVGTIIAVGKAAAVGDIDRNSPGAFADLLAPSYFYGRGCTLWFSLPVKRTDFYEIELGHRGGVPYSRNELDEKKWRVELTLGNK